RQPKRRTYFLGTYNPTPDSEWLSGDPGEDAANESGDIGARPFGDGDFTVHGSADEARRFEPVVGHCGGFLAFDADLLVQVRERRGVEFRRDRREDLFQLWVLLGETGRDGDRGV